MKNALKWCFLLFGIASWQAVGRGQEQPSTEGDSSLNENYENNPDTSGQQSEDDRHNIEWNCTDKAGTDPNIRKNFEEMIKVAVRERLRPGACAAAEALAAHELDAAADLQRAARELQHQLTSSADKITDNINSALRTKTMTQLIEKLHIRLAAIENELQKFATVENNKIKEINEFSDKIMLLIKKNEALSEKVELNSKEQHESMEVINHKLAMLANIYTSVDNNVSNLLNITEGIQESVEKSNIVLEILLSNATETGKDENMITSLCDVKVPSSVVIEHGTWKDKQTPEEDDLDSFMVKKTGCSFVALEYNKNFALAAAALDAGGALEWRLAVRSRANADLGISWPRHGFSFFAGQKMNTVSSLRQWNPEEVWERATPGLLSADRYVPLYVRIHKGTLTAGAACGGEPFFSRAVRAPPHAAVYRLIKSWSSQGAKFLYDCPAGVGVTGLSKK